MSSTAVDRHGILHDPDCQNFVLTQPLMEASPCQSMSERHTLLARLLGSQPGQFVMLVYKCRPTDFGFADRSVDERLQK